MLSGLCTILECCGNVGGSSYLFVSLWNINNLSKIYFRLSYFQNNWQSLNVRHILVAKGNALAYAAATFPFYSGTTRSKECNTWSVGNALTPWCRCSSIQRWHQWEGNLVEERVYMHGVRPVAPPIWSCCLSKSLLHVPACIAHGPSHMGKAGMNHIIHTQWFAPGITAVTRQLCERCMICLQNWKGKAQATHNHLPPPAGPFVNMRIDFVHIKL